MVKVVSIPGTACQDLPPKVVDFFESTGATWQVHLRQQENGVGWVTNTLQESVARILEHFDVSSPETSLEIQAHSYGARLLMRAIILCPDILKKISLIRLINPPHHSEELSHQFASGRGLGKVLKKSHPKIDFTPEYITSLQSDTKTLFSTFIRALLRASFSGKIETWSTPIDSLLRASIAPDDENCLFDSSVSTAPFDLDCQDISYRNTSADTLNYSFYWHPFGHNFEYFPGK